MDRHSYSASQLRTQSRGLIHRLVDNSLYHLSHSCPVNGGASQSIHRLASQWHVSMSESNSFTKIKTAIFLKPGRQGNGCMNTVIPESLTKSHRPHYLLCGLNVVHCVMFVLHANYLSDFHTRCYNNPRHFEVVVL